MYSLAGTLLANWQNVKHVTGYYIEYVNVTLHINIETYIFSLSSTIIVFDVFSKNTLNQKSRSKKHDILNASLKNVIFNFSSKVKLVEYLTCDWITKDLDCSRITYRDKTTNVILCRKRLHFCLYAESNVDFILAAANMVFIFQYNPSDWMKNIFFPIR